MMTMSTVREPVEYKLVEVSSEASRSPQRSPRRPQRPPRTPTRNQGAPANMNVLPKSTKVYLSEGSIAYVVRQCSTGEYEIHVPSVACNFRATRDEFSLKWPVAIPETEKYKASGKLRPRAHPSQRRGKHVAGQSARTEDASLQTGSLEISAPTSPQQPKSPTASQTTMQAATPAQQSFEDPWRAKSPQDPQRDFYGMSHPDPIGTASPQRPVNRTQQVSYGAPRGGYQSENRPQQPSGYQQGNYSPPTQGPPYSNWTSTRSEPPRQAQARPEPRSIPSTTPKTIGEQQAQQAHLSKQQNGRDFNRPNQPQQRGNGYRGKNDWLGVSSRSPRSQPGRRQGRPQTKPPPGLGPRQSARPRNSNTASSGQRRAAPAQQETRAPRTPQRPRQSYTKHQDNRVSLPTGPKVGGHGEKPQDAAAAASAKKQPVTYFKNTCRHFLSDEGCRRGSKCRFYHPGEQTKVNKNEFCTMAANAARDEGDSFSRTRGRKSGKAQRQRYEACDL